MRWLALGHVTRSRRRPPSTRPASSSDDLRGSRLRQIGDGAATYRGTYANSADYGREIDVHRRPSCTWRPRYQRWHARAPRDAPTSQPRCAMATSRRSRRRWDLHLAPAAELTDQSAPPGRPAAPGRKIAIAAAARAAASRAEPHRTAQAARVARSIEAARRRGRARRRQGARRSVQLSRHRRLPARRPAVLR